eukprot:Rhum_TRINITY_DN9178_c0_g1::Rhum_TRINITY_DN9178_c0_g1_i1::g.31957::m.31957/K11412/SIRT2, SIR2L2; NAD-dependent deacetylase sirtuin 2
MIPFSAGTGAQLIIAAFRALQQQQQRAASAAASAGVGASGGGAAAPPPEPPSDAAAAAAAAQDDASPPDFPAARQSVRPAISSASDGDCWVSADAARASGLEATLTSGLDAGDEYIRVNSELARRLTREARLNRAAYRGLLPDLSLQDFAEHVKGCERVVVVCGAGISTAAGIPDFRSPTGLYAQIQREGGNPCKLPYPEALFDIDYFKEKPKAFYRFTENLWPGQFAPTGVHRLLRVLQDRGVLSRVYTQNIDGLERLAGLKSSHLIEAHGHMSAAHCIDCDKTFSPGFVKRALDDGVVPTCSRCVVDDGRPRVSVEDCDGEPGHPLRLRGLVKPQIVFFSESLPERYVRNCSTDLEEAEALIIIGTSLTVAPFCTLPSMTPASCPRLLINNETANVGVRAGFVTTGEYAYRDIALQGDCQDGAAALLEALGWQGDAEALEAADGVSAAASGSPGSTETARAEFLKRRRDDASPTAPSLSSGGSPAKRSRRDDDSSASPS